MIEAGGKMKIEVSSDDLVLFADRLIEKAMEAKALMMEQTPEDETWLSTDKLPRCAVFVRPHSGHGRRKATSCLHAWAERSGTLFPPSRSYFPYIPMWQQPTDSGLQPFVSTTARYGFAALPLGCSPLSVFPLFPFRQHGNLDCHV